MSSHVRVTVTILKEDNFSDWLIDVRAHLRRDKLWKYCIEAPPGEKNNDWLEKAQEAADFLTPSISAPIKRKLTEAEFDNGYLMINRLTTLLAPRGDAQFMRLTKEYYTLSTDHFKDIPAFLDRVKVLEEQIDATKVEFTGDKRTLLCLSMALPDYYRPLVQLWSITPDMTAEKAKEMLLEEYRRGIDQLKEGEARALAGSLAWVGISPQTLRIPRRHRGTHVGIHWYFRDFSESKEALAARRG